MACFHGAMEEISAGTTSIIGTGLDEVPSRLYDGQATNRSGPRVKIITHTKYGVFKGAETKYSEAEYRKVGQFLEQVNKLEFEYFSFTTDEGEVYMSKEMINDSLFVLEK